MKTRTAVAIFAVIVLAASLGVVSAMPVGPESALEREVGHRLRMLPTIRSSTSCDTASMVITSPWTAL